MVQNVIAAVLSLGLMGLAFGAILAYASKVFAVKVDERVSRIVEVLPGANCGGCGFAGCAALASAIVDGRAPVNGCPVGGSACAENVAAIMGVEAETGGRKVAYVACNGTCNAAKSRYQYVGIADCVSVMRLGGGDKECVYGCTGLGTCVKACQFGALSLVDGVAKVDKELCTACGMCISACPKKIISMVPCDSLVHVACSSKDKGADARKFCDVSCIACKICEKACPSDAIHVINNVAVIDYDKCTNCGLCAEKCPRKCIEAPGKEQETARNEQPQQKEAE